MSTTITRQLRRAEAELAGKKAALAGILAEAGPRHDVSLIKSLPGDRSTRIAQIIARRAEIDALEESLTMAKAAHLVGAGAGIASLGEQIVASRAVKARGQRSADGAGPTAEIDAEVKILMTTSAGWAPEPYRTARVGLAATGTTSMLDLIPVLPITSASAEFMRETAVTTAAAERAEGAAAAEAALTLGAASEPVRSVDVWLPVTEELLEDDARAAAYIDARLPLLARQRLAAEVLIGAGTAPNLRGLLNVVGIQTQAKGADTAPDAVRKALTKVRLTGHATPDAVVLHPTNWEAIQLLKDSAGQPLWPHEQIWDLPVIQSEAITLGTALVGAFGEQAELDVKRGITVQVSNSHGTYFTEGKVAIKATIRCALIAYRPTAFCSTTGL